MLVSPCFIDSSSGCKRGLTFAELKNAVSLEASEISRDLSRHRTVACFACQQLRARDDRVSPHYDSARPVPPKEMLSADEFGRGT